MVVVVTLTTGFVLGRSIESQQSAASEPSPKIELPSRPPMSPKASESPSEEPTHELVPLEPDDTWDGPSGTMRLTGTDEVALTFDDGPSPSWTPKVLNTLAEWDVKATFCVVGKEAKAYPELVQDIVNQGHTLCNHSWNHEYELGSLSAPEIRKNLERTNEAILEAVPGAYIGYYRQPGGQWTNRVVGVSMKMGMIPLHWSVDPSDWDKSVKAGHIEKEVRGATDAGAIVLMHDGGGDRGRTYSALEPILSDLTSRFALVPLP